MPTTVLDVEQHLLLLELEAPFDKRDVQLARRRMAKRWHPDIAPAGTAVRARAPPEGDQRGRRPARAPGRGLARRAGLAQRRARRAPPPRAASARRRAGAPTKPSSARARSAKDRAKHDPFGSRVPDHSVVHRYARCVSYPEWGVGTVAGIYFTDDDGRRRGGAAVGAGASSATASARCPAGSMQFVDFSKPDPAEERVERFLIAAQRAMAEGEYELAAQRLIYARDAEPRNVAVLRLMTLAFWQAGKLDAGRARRARLGARRRRAARRAHRFAARIYEDMGAVDLAEEAADRAAAARPGRRGRVGAPRAPAAAAARPRGRARRAPARDRARRRRTTSRELIAQALALEPRAGVERLTAS